MGEGCRGGWIGHIWTARHLDFTNYRHWFQVKRALSSFPQHRRIIGVAFCVNGIGQWFTEKGCRGDGVRCVWMAKVTILTIVCPKMGWTVGGLAWGHQWVETCMSGLHVSGCKCKQVGKQPCVNWCVSSRCMSRYIYSWCVGSGYIDKQRAWKREDIQVRYVSRVYVSRYVHKQGICKGVCCQQHAYKQAC